MKNTFNKQKLMINIASIYKFNKYIKYQFNIIQIISKNKHNIIKNNETGSIPNQYLKLNQS